MTETPPVHLDVRVEVRVAGVRGEWTLDTGRWRCEQHGDRRCAHLDALAAFVDRTRRPT